MLKKLSIRNFAVIDALDLEPGAGLNIFTGETGAGKSIIISALGFLLGERSGSDILRPGSASAEVETDLWARLRAGFRLGESDPALTRVQEEWFRAHPDYLQRGIARKDLLVRVGYLLDVASRRGAVLSDPLKTALRNRRAYIVDAETADLHRHAESGGIPEPLGKTGERSRRMGQAVEGIVDEVLKMFEAAKWVHVRRFDDQDIYITKTEGRLHLDYYKNNMLHLFVPDALLASSVLALQVQADELDPQELSDMTKFLSRLLKFEFVYAPGVSFEQMYQGTLEAFEESSWLVVTANGKLRLRPTVLPVIRLYAKLVQNFIESYALMGRALSVLQKGPMAEKDFLEHVQNEAAKAFELGGVQCYEAVSRVNLGNALKIFVEQAYVRSYSEGSGKKRVKMLTVKHGEGTGAQLAGYVQRIRDLAAPWGIDR